MTWTSRLSKAWSCFWDCLREEEPAPAPDPEEGLGGARSRLLGLLAARPAEEKSPDTSRSGAPYRAPATILPPPKPEWEELCVDGGARVMFKVVRRGDCSEEEFAVLRAKARRRAVRHFRGKEVKHRVVRKSADEIELSFFRRSTYKGPVKVAMRREALVPNVSQVGSA